MAAVLLAAGPVGTRPAAAGVVSHGPVVAVGFAEKLGRDMVIPTFGWRVELGACERVAGWMSRIGTELTFPIESTLGVITGDEDEVEFQVVPMLRFEPLGLQESPLIPFLEGGIGLMYTGLDDLRLGSNILFSDNVAVGVSLPLPAPLPGNRVSVSYRYRHSSHAGLWAESNSGLNTHYLVLTFE